VEIGIDEGNVCPFVPISLGVLAPGAGTDEFRGLFGSQILVFITHRLGVPGGSFPPSWDEPESSAAVRERHDQVSVFEGSAEYDKALLIDGVVRVRSG